MSKGKTIAFDFDGTLHPYEEGWCGSEPTDAPPLPGVPYMLRTLHARGFRLVIFSCRADHPAGEIGIKKWLQNHDLAGYISEITGAKPKATAYIDDRGVPFRPRALGYEEACKQAVEDVIRIAQYEGHGSAQ